MPAPFIGGIEPVFNNLFRKTFSGYPSAENENIGIKWRLLWIAV